MRVITLGTFDLFHYGHVNLLKKCRELGDFVIVGLNSDGFIERYKGKKPVMSYQERRESILATELADKVVENDQTNGSARDLIKECAVDLIVIGSDWARKDYVDQLRINWDWLDRQGIGICYVNYTHGISTTELKKRICESV